MSVCLSVTSFIFMLYFVYDVNDVADSCVSGSAKETGTAAKTAALCKEAKCDSAKNLAFSASWL